MGKNASPLRIAPLQRVVAEPITDPAEQATLDELRRRERDNVPLQPTQLATRGAESAAISQVLDLSQHLSAEERVSLLARLAADVPAERQLELLAQMMSQLSPAALQSLEEELAARLGKR